MRYIACFFLLLAGAAACTKHNAPPESSFQLTVTVDAALGSVSRLGATDTFVVRLNNPQACILLPVELHIPKGARSSLGNQMDDSTWSASVTLSWNKVVSVTVTAANGNSGTYAIVYDYVFSTQPLMTGGVQAFPRGVFFAGDTLYIPTSAGLYVSADSGGHFSILLPSNGLGDSIVNGVYVRGGVIYAATVGGLSVSTDGGQHFTNHLLGGNPVYSVYVQGDTVYAGTDGGVYISRDGGMNYTTSVVGMGNRETLAVYARGSTVYAGTANGLAISPNGGVSFTNYTNNGLGSLGGQYQCNGLAVQGSNVYVATIGGFSVSADGGVSFTNYYSAAGLGANWTNGVDVQDGVIWVGTNGGLSYSLDGGAHFATITADIGLGTELVYGSVLRGTTIYSATGAGLSVIRSRL
ncbi:hypothetical protein [Puia dinghuensis]|uniref:Uncharacterized protein n=1 Tax=Puia dinghuensis TaxID=1792502 RepID=A0A8J2UGP6_9BACT|nr:hypothetical protein [Puia dinghuensis]GGB15070.1 hypothetical protein GCM10011511_43520 [Puia dinghuensis]